MTPTDSTVIDFPAQAIAAEAQSWPSRARGVVIADDTSYRGACDLLLGIKDLRKRVAEVHDPNIKRWHDGHRAAIKDKKESDDPLDEAERIIKRSLAAWDEAQERERRERQRQADEEARQRDETERLERAAAMEIEGKEYGDDALVQEAHALIEPPPMAVVAAPVAKAVPKVSGVSYRKVPKFRIVNPDLVPRQYCAPVESKIRGVVNSLGDKANIPGVQVYFETVVAAGGR